MDEQGEIPQKEQVVIPPELQAQMEQSMQNIESGMGEPAVEIANGTQQMGMFSELWKLWKDANVKRLGIMFKDAKVALGILPFVDRVSKWNTARIASKPIEGLSKEALQARKIAQRELNTRNASVVGKVESAMQAEGAAIRSEKILGKAEIEMDRAATQYEKAMGKGKKIEKAADRLHKAESAYTTSESAQVAAIHVQTKAQEQAVKILEKTSKEPFANESWISKQARKIAHIHTDSEFASEFKRLKEKTAGRGFSDADIVRMVANGESPVFTKREKFGRGTKKLGIHMILTNLGPIINPIPDVPHLVANASYAIEAFGGQWYAGLIPPVWQYLHNRYEDMALGFHTSKQAMEIVNRHWNQRIDRLEEKKIEKAAGVFLPKKELPLAA